MAVTKIEQQTDVTRLRELVLLIASKSESDPRFGSVKLNKLLYYIDNRAYRELGRPISEATYLKVSEGPAPKEMPRVLRELQADGAIELEARAFHDRTQRRAVCKRNANLEAFSIEERRIIDSVVEELFYLSDRQISEQSRQEWGWKLAKDGDVIPFAASWLAAGPLTQDQEAAGAALWNEIAT